MVEGEAMQAIKNLGDLERMVRPMINDANILSIQRKQTYENLYRLRVIAQSFLTTYESNRSNLEELYQTIKKEAQSSTSNQEESLNELSEILRQALADPTKDNVNGLIGEVDELIQQMSERSPQPSQPAGTGVPSTGTERPTQIFTGQTQRLTPFGPSRPPPGRGGGRSKKKRSTKRGGYSWRTPSPNKSRKKTIKKTRTRQN